MIRKSIIFLLVLVAFSGVAVELIIPRTDAQAILGSAGRRGVDLGIGTGRRLFVGVTSDRRPTECAIVEQGCFYDSCLPYDPIFSIEYTQKGSGTVPAMLRLTKVLGLMAWWGTAELGGTSYSIAGVGIRPLLLATIAAVYPFLLLRGAACRWRRRRRNQCVKCGYGLQGLPEPRCPECGTVARR